MKVTKNVVYVVMGDTWTGNLFCSTTIEGIHDTLEGANEHLLQLIPDEKRRILNARFDTSEEEMDKLLAFHCIEWSINTYSDGSKGFTIEDKRQKHTTFLKIIERELLK